MRKIVKLLYCFIVLLLSKPSSGDENFGLHTSGGTNFQNSANFNIGLKIRSLRYCPIGFEMTVIIPYGLTLAAPIYIVKTRYFLAHIIAPYTGIHFPVGSKRIAIKWLKNDVPYLVFGAGAEARLPPWKWLAAQGATSWSVNTDWRVFVPEFAYMRRTFGDYTTKLLKQSLKESELWLGVSFWY